MANKALLEVTFFQGQPPKTDREPSNMSSPPTEAQWQGLTKLLQTFIQRVDAGMYAVVVGVVGIIQPMDVWIPTITHSHRPTLFLFSA
jgi:hypothetical protein